MRIPVALLAAALFAGAIPAHAQNTPRWSTPAAQLTTADTALRFTTSGRSLSVLFDRFVVEAQGTAAPMLATRTATFSAALDSVVPGVPVRFQQDLRAAVTKDADARVVIVVVMPDRTETLVFPYGRPMDEGALFRRFRSTMRVRPGQQYAASFFVRVDRRSPGAVGHVTLSSFDVEASQARR
jgi:hypothetical protein